MHDIGEIIFCNGVYFYVVFDSNLSPRLCLYCTSIACQVHGFICLLNRTKPDTPWNCKNDTISIYFDTGSSDGKTEDCWWINWSKNWQQLCIGNFNGSKFLPLKNLFIQSLDDGANWILYFTEHSRSESIWAPWISFSIPPAWYEWHSTFLHDTSYLVGQFRWHLLSGKVFTLGYRVSNSKFGTILPHMFAKLQIKIRKAFLHQTDPICLYSNGLQIKSPNFLVQMLLHPMNQYFDILIRGTSTRYTFY